MNYLCQKIVANFFFCPKSFEVLEVRFVKKRKADLKLLHVLYYPMAPSAFSYGLAIINSMKAQVDNQK